MGDTKHKQTLEPLMRYGRAHRRYFAQGLAGTVGLVFFRVAIPWPLRAVVEVAFPASSHRGDTVLGLLPSWGEPLLWICGAYLVCAIGGGLTEMVQRVGMVRFVSRTVRDLRAAVMRSVGHRSPSTDSSTGELVVRLVADGGRLRSDLTGILVHLSKDGLLFIAVAALFLLWISPAIGLFFLVGGIIAGWIGYIAARPVEAEARRARHREGVLAHTIQQAVEQGHRTAPSAARRETDDESDRDARSTRILATASLAVQALFGLTVCFAVWFGVVEVRAGALASGELFLFIAYSLTVHRRLVDAGRQLARVGKVRASLERLAPLVRADGAPVPSVRALRLGVRLEKLGVDGVRRRPRLADFTCEFLAGSRVAVLGGPGDGKSTLLRALAGVEPAVSGSIRWDEQSLDPLDPAVSGSVGFLPQDPVFSPAPVWQVLGLAGPDAIDAEQIDVLRDVGAWKIIERLPKNLSQKVGSATLSRSEARALSLGAVLIGGAPLIALDSPMEGLSKRSAAKRFEAIVRATEGRTLVMAVPQLRDPRSFEHVIVLRRGRVEFDGTPVQWRAWKAAARHEEATACRA